MLAGPFSPKWYVDAFDGFDESVFEIADVMDGVIKLLLSVPDYQLVSIDRF